MNDAEFKQTAQGSTVMQAGVATVQAAPNYEPEPFTEREVVR